VTCWGVGFEEGSYYRLIDFLYHPTLGSRVIKKKKEESGTRRLSVRSIQGKLNEGICRAARRVFAPLWDCSRWPCTPPIHPPPHTPHPTPHTLHLKLYTLYPSRYNQHSTPYTHAPHTLHPTLNTTPFTLHPIPYTFHPTLHTLHCVGHTHARAGHRQAHSCPARALTGLIPM